LDFIEGEMAQRGVTQELIDETRSSTERIMLRDLMELVRTGGDLEEPDYQCATPVSNSSFDPFKFLKLTKVGKNSGKIELLKKILRINK